MQQGKAMFQLKHRLERAKISQTHDSLSTGDDNPIPEVDAMPDLVPADNNNDGNDNDNGIGEGSGVQGEPLLSRWAPLVGCQRGVHRRGRSSYERS